MNKIVLALGSNICRQVALTHAVKSLNKVLVNTVYSDVYQSVPLHAKGPDFYNAVVCGETELSLPEILAFTKKTEQEMGRYPWNDNQGETHSIRCLDIDILLFNDVISEEPQLPREDVFKYDFVVIPLVSIAPNIIPPGSSLTIKEISKNFTNHNLQIVDNCDLAAI